MADQEMGRRVSFLEGAFSEMNERMTTLQWMVGLSTAWHTMLIGAAVGVLLKCG